MTDHSFGYFLDYNLLLAVGIPLTGLAIGLGRHFWKKEKCFIRMANTIKRLETAENQDEQKHDDYEERIKVIEKDVTEMKIYLKLLLDKEKIKY